jgi:hypothetical protein
VSGGSECPVCRHLGANQCRAFLKPGPFFKADFTRRLGNTPTLTESLFGHLVFKNITDMQRWGGWGLLSD